MKSVSLSTIYLLLPVVLFMATVFPVHAVDEDWMEDPKGVWYLGYKIPTISKPWTSLEYRRMLTVLKTIKEKKPDSLPRRGGEFTGPVFERMINKENFTQQLQIYAPIELRREEAASVLFILKEIMRVYFDFSANQQPYGTEALGLMAYSIRQQAILFTITVEFWLTLSNKEQQNPERLNGLNGSKDAAATLANSALDYLNLATQFEESDLTIYAYELVDIYPELFVHLKQDAKKAIKAKVKKIHNNHKIDTVKDAMGQLHAILKQL